MRTFFLKYVLSQNPSRFMGYYLIVAGLFFALMPLPMRRLEGFIAIADADDIMRRIAQIEDGLR